MTRYFCYRYYRDNEVLGIKISELILQSASFKNQDKCKSAALRGLRRWNKYSKLVGYWQLIEIVEFGTKIKSIEWFDL